MEWTPIGWAQFTNLSAAVTLATATPANGTAYSALTYGANGNRVIPRHVMISPETKDIRYHDNGSTPTSTIGTLLAFGSHHAIEDSAEAIRNFKMIETAASASVMVRYYI